MSAGGRLLAALLIVAAAPAAAAPALVAEQIGDENAAAWQIGGPDAIGGVGDWVLANDRIEIVVDDPSRRYGKLDTGGTIVDAGLRGRKGDDQFARLFPLVNLSQRVQLGYDTIRAELDPQGRWARLVVSGRHGLSSIARGGALARRFDPLVPDSAEIRCVSAETEYRVQPGEPFVRITTTLRNQCDRPAPVFSFGEVWMRGGRSMRSFVGNTLAPERSRGFHHLSFDRDNILAASSAMAPFTFVAMAGLPEFPPIAYAIFSPERTARGLPSFGVTGEHVTLIDAYTSDPSWDSLGLLRMLAGTRQELAPGAVWSYPRRLLVTAGPDVASATDVLFPLLGAATGRCGVEGAVEPAGLEVSVLVERAQDGAPVTQVMAARSGPRAGRYRAVLPPGRYALTLRAPGRAPRRIEVAVAEDAFAEAPSQRFEPLAALRFAPAFAGGGAGRVIVTGVGGTPDPVFRPELLDFRVDGQLEPSGRETREIQFIGNAHDPERVELAPGHYLLTATRGPEWEIEEREIELTGPGAEVAVPPFDLRRVAVLRGVLAADLHVHAEASDDSGMANEDRLRSYVAEHVDVMVTTDHDHLGHFDPALAALDLAGRIRVIQGVEVTSSAPSPAAPWTIGHHNAWPLVYRPTAHRQGAPPSQDLTVAELYASLRRDYGAQVVQLNHPFSNGGALEDQAYLSHLGSAGRPFRADRPIDEGDNRLLLEPGPDGRTRAVDFDAIEVMNGAPWGRYLRSREAWYALLRQGFRRTATGNSDTHGPDEAAGYPRNYVYAGPGEFDLAGFDAALREGRSFASNGPLLAAFQVNGGRLGDLVAAPGGRAEVHYAVVAASWVPVDEVRLLVNGRVVRTHTDLAPASEPMRLDAREQLQLDRDAFVTVEAGAPLDVDPQRWIAQRGGAYASRIAPGFVAQEISNPIFVDVDGDGRFEAPGLEPPPGADAARRRLVGTLVAVLVLALVWWRLRARAGLAPRD